MRPQLAVVAVVIATLLLLVVPPSREQQQGTFTQQADAGEPVLFQGVTYDVQRVERAATMRDAFNRPQKPRGVFVIVTVRLSAAVRSFSGLRLVDAFSDDGDVYQLADEGRDLFGEADLHARQVHPGLPFTGSVVFDVEPGDADSLELRVLDAVPGEGRRQRLLVDLGKTEQA